MSTFGDPGFLVHKGMGQYLTLLAYHLATDESLPLEPVNFANEMDIYYQDLQYTVGNASQDVDISELRQAIDTFRAQAEEAESLMATAVEEGNSDLVRVQNYKFRDFHRGFTSQGGLPNREFYRHVIFAPGKFITSSLSSAKADLPHLKCRRQRMGLLPLFSIAAPPRWYKEMWFMQGTIRASNVQATPDV